MRPIVAQERAAIASLLGIKPHNLKHTISPRAFDIANGGTVNIDVVIPRAQSFLITHVEVEGYPKDAGGNYVQSERVERAPFDTVTFQFFVEGKAQTRATDYHFFLGNIFRPFAGGDLRLQVVYTAIDAAATAQRLIVTLHGYRIPDTADGTQGLDTALSQLAQIETSPAEIS